MKIILVLVLCGLALCFAQDAGVLRATVKYIEGSANVNATGSTARYRITLKNVGTCTLKQAILDLDITGGSYLDGQNVTTVIGGMFSILGFGASLVPQSSYSGASISVSFPTANYPTSISVRSAMGQYLQGCQAPSATVSSCSARANVQYRENSIMIDAEGRFVAVYDVFVDNAGSCGITDIALSITIPSGAEVISTNNLSSTRGGYLVTGYGNAIAHSTSYQGASVTVAFEASGYAQSLDAPIYGTNCESCASSPTTAPPAQSGNCAADIKINLRSGATWSDGVDKFGVFDVVVTNTGKCTLSAVKLSVSLPSDVEITQTWNLKSISSSSYDLQNFYQIAAGQTFSGAGAIFRFRNEQDVATTVRASSLSSACTTTCSA